MALDITIGGTSSNSFVTLAEWQAYWAARGVDVTQHGHDDAHEANLIQAADFLNRKYSYVGDRQYQYQSMSWPRLTDVVIEGWPINPDTIPQALKDAQMELAYLIHEGLNPTATVSGVVSRKMNKAGPVETETEYLGGMSTPRIVAIEGLLRDYLAVGQGQYGLARS